jgi:hypothetical protein
MPHSTEFLYIKKLPYICHSMLCHLVWNSSNKIFLPTPRYAELSQIEFLREFESIFKTALAHESGDPGVPFNGTVARDFRPSGFFFHRSTSPGALIHGLRPFRIWPRIRRENRQYSNFSGVIDTAENNLFQLLVKLVMTCEMVIALSCIPLVTNWRKYGSQKAMHSVPFSKQFISS